MGSLNQMRSLAWVKAVGFAAALALLAGPALAEAGDSIWARDKLTGDWGGTRGWLADHGVTSQLEMTGFYQGLFSGSGHSAFEPGARIDALLNFDSGKLGLWEGGGLHTHLEYPPRRRLRG